jgi:hypothetical protein
MAMAEDEVPAELFLENDIEGLESEWTIRSAA